MADYFPCHISIGGPVPKRLRKKFLEAIDDAGLSLEWDGAQFEPTEIQDVLDAADGGDLQLVDGQASGGCKVDLEKFLQDNKIAFDRHSDSKHEYSASRFVFRPGVLAKHFDSNQDGDTLIPYADVDKVRKLLKGTARPETLIRAALHQLRDIAPEIPDLEPISFPE